MQLHRVDFDLLAQIQQDDQVSYKPFSSAKELRDLLENDLALLLTERFMSAQPRPLAARHAADP